MVHGSRRHRIQAVEALDELCLMLTQRDWHCCDGFSHAGLLLVNDSTSADGAQEYAVFRMDRPNRQIESITVSWCTAERLMGLLGRLLDGSNPGCDMGTAELQPHKDGACVHCG
jgi:hypothetical protein